MLPLLLVPALSLSLSALSLPNALLFEAVRDQQGRSILFIRDCGRGGLPQDVSALGVSRCEPWQTMFAGDGGYVDRSGARRRYEGDSVALARALQRQRFDEVWLFSGGGDLGQGVAIGRLLRRARMTVRVPNVTRVRSAMPWPDPQSNVRCISSCTVAFMGGLFRFLDEDATYEVHSASGVLQEVDSVRTALMLNGRLGQAADMACQGGRYWASKLFQYFQNSLLLTTRYPPVVENEALYEEYAMRGSATMRFTATEQARDLERLRAEGIVAVQDLYMRYERRCVQAALADLRTTPAAQTPRAGPALRMVEVMYDVSIKETAALTRETMLRMGYLTQEIAPTVKPPEEP
jgi:hypothetical protein